MSRLFRFRLIFLNNNDILYIIFVALFSERKVMVSLKKIIQFSKPLQNQKEPNIISVYKLSKAAQHVCRKICMTLDTPCFKFLTNHRTSYLMYYVVFEKFKARCVIQIFRLFNVYRDSQAQGQCAGQVGKFMNYNKSSYLQKGLLCSRISYFFVW